MTTPTTAYSYARFSSARQGKGDSIRRQTTGPEAACREHGWTLDTQLTFRDPGVSAFHGKNFTEGRLGAFLQTVKAGTVKAGSVLIVENLDRISRQKARTALKTLEAIIDAGVGVYTMMDRQFITAATLDKDPMQLIMSVLTFTRANEESETKSNRGKARWQAARAKATESKKPFGGHCPFWTKPNQDRTGYEIIPAAMATAKRIVSMALAGFGPFNIAKKLNADGIVSARGKKTWQTNTVLALLKSKTLIGEYQPRNNDHKAMGEAVKSYYPAVCTEAEYYQIQAATAARSTGGMSRGRTGKSIANLFSGLLYHESGCSMKICNPGRLVPTAAAAGTCGWAAFSYRAFEEGFLRWVSEVQISPTTRSSKLEAIETELGMHRERLTKLQAAMDESPDVDTFIQSVKKTAVRVRTLEAEREAEKAKNATPTVSTQDITALYAKLATMPEEQQEATRAQLRQAIAGVVKRIDVAYSAVKSVNIAAVQVWLSNGTHRVMIIRHHRGEKCANGAPATIVAGTPAISVNQDRYNLAAMVKAIHAAPNGTPEALTAAVWSAAEQQGRERMQAA